MVMSIIHGVLLVSSATLVRHISECMLDQDMQGKNGPIS